MIDAHSTTHHTGPKRKTVVLVAGTAAVILIAGLLFQVFRGDSPGQQEAVAAVQDGTAALSAQRSQKLARVGDILITKDQVAQQCLDIYGRAVLDDMINRAIIHQACRDQGVQVNEAEIDRKIIEIAKSFNNMSVQQWYQFIEAEKGTSPVQYRRHVIWPMLALRKLAGTQTQITREEIQRAFKRDYGPRMKGRMIMLDNWNRARKAWDDARRDPDNFGALARKYSIEPTSAPLDGAILPIRKYGPDEKLWQEAFKLRKGEISGIIQLANNRYVILLCEGFTQPTVDGIDEVLGRINEHLREEKIARSVAQVFQKLKDETRVDNYFTGTTTGGIQQVSGTQSGSVNQAGGVRPGDSSRQRETTTDGRLQRRR